MSQFYWRFRHFWGFIVAGFGVLFGIPDDVNATRDWIMDQIHTERERQLKKWGVQHHPDATGHPGDIVAANAAKEHYENMSALGLLSWREILDEEVAEAYAESDTSLLRAELIQCAAVIVAWIEDIDTRKR